MYLRLQYLFFCRIFLFVRLLMLFIFFNSSVPKVASHFPARSQDSCEFAAPFWMWSAGWATLVAHRVKPLASYSLRPTVARRERTLEDVFLGIATQRHRPTKSNNPLSMQKQRVVPSKTISTFHWRREPRPALFVCSNRVGNFCISSLELARHNQFNSTCGFWWHLQTDVGWKCCNKVNFQFCFILKDATTQKFGRTQWIECLFFSFSCWHCSFSLKALKLWRDTLNYVGN